jgi:hypothetical protein
MEVATEVYEVNAVKSISGERNSADVEERNEPALTLAVIWVGLDHLTRAIFARH